VDGFLQQRIGQDLHNSDLHVSSALPIMSAHQTNP